MFNEINISQQTAEQISNDIKRARLSHAIILEGGDEETRSLAAIEIAKAIFCKSENPPCNECKSCKKIIHASHPDLHIVQKEDDENVIKVDTIREMKAATMLMPNDGDESVFILKEASFLNEAGANALLKLFEEPQSHVHIILTVNTSSNLIETILSRGTIYNLAPNRNNPANDEKAKDIADEIINCLCQKTEFDLIVHLLKIKKDKDKASLITALNIVQFEATNALLKKSNATDDKNYLSNHAVEMAEHLSSEKIIQAVENCKFIIEKLNANCNFNLIIAQLASGFYK